MPKMKTRRAAAKRFSVTGSGKLRARKCGKSHLLTHKNRKRKRRLKKFEVITSTRVKGVFRAIPYAN